VADEDRPQYQHGVGTIGGAQFHWGSGTPGKYWSIPYGDYPVTPDAPTGAWAQGAGAIPLSNNVIPDPLLHRNRIGIMIHSGSAPDLDTLYTQGCFKVAPSEWPAVRSEILAEAKQGPLYLHVAPGGVAAFTNTPTFSQAGDETPAANANATANTTAAKPSYSFTLPPNAPMGMGNNNPLNIKYFEGASYPGLVGPSRNTDQGDPQMVFQTPEAGWGAAYTLLSKKYGSGMTTPNQIIAGKGGWTPGNAQAAANVAKSAGIGPDDDIGFSDPAKAQKFMRALVTQEQGGAGSAYPDAMIAAAITGKPAPAVATAATPGTTINTVPTSAVAGAGGGSVLPGFSDAKTSDKFKKDVGDFSKAMGYGGQGDDQAPRFQPTGPAPAARNTSPLGGALLPASSQAYGQTLNSIAEPTQWGSAPPGSMPGAQTGQQQAPGGASPYGTSLAGLQMAYGLSPQQLQMLMSPMMLNQGGSYG
jgi:hypothetical protein